MDCARGLGAAPPPLPDTKKAAASLSGSRRMDANAADYSSATSGSATRMRPQYSQTMIFLPWRMST